MRHRRILTFHNRAQISIEYILIVGLLLSMILIVYPYALKENELNKALAAARDGATYVIALKGLGYRYTGMETPAGVMKIDRLELIPQGTLPNGKEDYLIRVHILAPSYIAENYGASIGTSVRQYARSYIYYAFYGTYAPSTSDVETNYYNFGIGYSITSYGD